MLRKRIIPGFVISIFLCGFLYFAENMVAASMFASLLCLFSNYELFKVSGLLKSEELFIPTLALSLIIQFIYVPNYIYLAISAFLSAIILFSYLMSKINDSPLDLRLIIVTISFIISLLFKTFSQFVFINNGKLNLAMGLLVCVVTDISAYFIGRRFGKNKLCPKISPNKTIEGALGGLVAAIIITLIVGLIIDLTTNIYVDYPRLIYSSFGISIVGQFGDLALSSVKRITGFKDYGTILLGHGGILDRFDSLLFGIPCVYIFCYLGYSFFV